MSALPTPTVQPDPWTAARELALRGIGVFPCNAQSKRPFTDHGFKDATTDLAVIDAWQRSYPDALIATPTGHASGYLIIDIDPKGAQWFAANQERLACTRTHLTRRGRHLLYRMPAQMDIRCSTNRLAKGVDVRSNGGYVIWWPAHGHGVEGDAPSDAPSWLLEELKRNRPSTPPCPADESDTGVTEGGRNDFLSREAFRMRKQGASVDQIVEMLLATNRAMCKPPLQEEDVRRIAVGKMSIEADPPRAVTADDFYALMTPHAYIFAPTGELWPGSSVDARVPPIALSSGKTLKASSWISKHRPVEQLTWAPGLPAIIENRLVSNGGWIERTGLRCFNQYLSPQITPGDSDGAGLWIDHMRRIYPDDADHIIRWCAHRVQTPQTKINHALVLGGDPGIGKDSLLEPLKYAVGPWNFSEVSPQQLLGRFNGFLKSVVLRVSEARDLGDVDRFAFYDHMKVFAAAPPDVLRCDEKNLREHAVLNVCGIIVTSNNKTDGIYLPPDDRRHFVAWSQSTRADFDESYWRNFWSWYANGGLQNVAAYLRSLDLSEFDAKAPPRKTDAFWEIADANRAPEDAEMADAIDVLKKPGAITLQDVGNAATSPEFKAWLEDRRNNRRIPHRLEAVGYVRVRNPDVADGQWVVDGRRQAVYARRELSVRERIAAARARLEVF